MREYAGYAGGVDDDGRRVLDDKDDQKRNVRDAIDSIYQIECTLPRRKPTLARWFGYHMANTSKWYFAYSIDGDTITIVDACHAQNMK